MKSSNETILTPVPADFDLSNPPVDRTQITGEDPAGSRDFDVLPRAYGIPLVCALARNPTSLFVFWEIDWSALFARTAPRNRQVHLRLQNSDGTEIRRIVIEPMVGYCDIFVPNSDSSYRVELGYFGVDEAWHSAGSATAVNTPADSLGDRLEGTFATVPYHLSFQRLTDQLRASADAGESVIAQLARLQEKALTRAGSASLTSAEGEVLRAIEANLPDGWRDGARNPGGEINLDRRLEEIMGFDSTSPASALGGSSRSG
jgi:hypothetical protein